jgi:ATP-dependent DNA helicase RecQ
MMHPAIFDLDAQLRERSVALSNITSDYEPRAANVAASSQEDPLLFDELRQWRLDRAHKDGVAPYMVLHDTTLHELAARRPQTKQALLGIKGMGATKVEKYSSDLLHIIANEP